MTTLGLIGSGQIGSTVARLAVEAGYDVVLSNSRGPETLAELVAELGPRARAASGAEAAAPETSCSSSVPLHAYPSLPAAPWPGRPCWIPATTTRSATGRSTALDTGSLTDSEYLARHLPGARVVKVFNNIFFKHLQNLARPGRVAPDRTYLPIAGDDAEAKRSVIEFLDSIGYGAVDAGRSPTAGGSSRAPRSTARPYGEFENEKGTPADAAVIRAALAAAARM